MKHDIGYAIFHQRIERLYELKRFKDCVKMCKETIALFPEEWYPYYTLVSAYYNSKQIQQAFDAVNQAIEKFPDNFHFWLSKGQILYFSKRYPEALVWLHKALERVPENVLVYALLAECYQRMEDYALGVTYAMKALALMPSHEVALRALSWCKVRTDSPDAEEIIASYLRAFPNSFEAHHIAAVYYLGENDKEKAAIHFKAALYIQPDREKAFDAYKDFLLEHVPEYYQNHKPIMRNFLIIEMLFLGLFFAALTWEWNIGVKVGSVLVIFVPFYYLITRNDFLLRLRKEERGLYELFLRHKVDVLEYGVLLLATLAALTVFWYFDWIVLYNILMITVIYVPKSTFLRRTNTRSNRFYLHYLLNIYMLGLFVYAFWSEKPLIGHFVVLMILTLLNVAYELWRSKKRDIIIGSL